MIHEIIDIAKGAGFELVPLIDYHALNVDLDRLHETGKSGYYVMLPKQEEHRYNEWSVDHVARIEIVGVKECPFTNDDRRDFDNVNAIAVSLKRDLLDIINALMDTGEYDNVSRISFAVVPYRFDSFQTAVTASFELSKPSELC